MFPVDGLAGGGDDGGTDGGVEGGIEGGLDDGGVLTTGVEGCNKLVIAEFWSKFKADREPLDEDAEPLPAEAAE
jgi:hypothetical protein